MKQVVIHWQDVKVYRNGGIYEPVHALTGGLLAKETRRHIFIKKPETLLFNPPRNHPEKKAALYCIPKSLITEMRTIKTKTDHGAKKREN